MYDVDGSLKRTPGMEETPDFERSTNGLIPVVLEEWEGFLFIRATEDGPSLSEYLGDMPEVFAGHRFSEMRCTVGWNTRWRAIGSS